jgi:hypothetical protein
MQFANLHPLPLPLSQAPFPQPSSRVVPALLFCSISRRTLPRRPRTGSVATSQRRNAMAGSGGASTGSRRGAADVVGSMRPARDGCSGGSGRAQMETPPPRCSVGVECGSGSAGTHRADRDNGCRPGCPHSHTRASRAHQASDRSRRDWRTSERSPWDADFQPSPGPGSLASTALKPPLSSAVGLGGSSPLRSGDWLSPGCSALRCVLPSRSSGLGDYPFRVAQASCQPAEGILGKNLTVQGQGSRQLSWPDQRRIGRRPGSDMSVSAEGTLDRRPGLASGASGSDPLQPPILPLKTVQPPAHRV